MSNFKSKLARRIMAFILSGAMVMSNMSAYAAELAPKETVEVEQSVETEKPDEDAADKDDAAAVDSADNDADSEKADTSKENNKVDGEDENDPPTEPSMAPISDLKIDDTNKDSGKWVLTWSGGTVTQADDGGYGDVEYVVTVKKGTDKISDLGTTITGTNLKYEFGFGESHEAGDYTFTVTATSKNSDTSKVDLTKEASVDYTYEKETDGQDTLAAPTNVKAELNNAKDSIDVSWDVVKEVSYEVVAKEQGEGSTVEIKKSVNAVTEVTENQKATVTFSVNDSLDSDKLVRGKSYKFSVTAKKDNESKTTEGTDIIEIPTTSENPSEVKKYTFEASELTAESTSANLAADTRNGEYAGTEKGENKYFRIWYHSNNTDISKLKSKVDTSAKSWADYNNTPGADGKIPSINRINFGAKIDVLTGDIPVENAIEFTTEKPTKVTVWWAANYDGNSDASKNREIAILKSDGSEVTKTQLGTSAKKNDPYKSTFRLSDAGTYYLGSLVGGNYIFKVEVEESETVSTRKSWDSVNDTPVVTAALKTTTSTDTEGNETTTEDLSTIVVTVTNAKIEDDGGDALTVTMNGDNMQTPEEKKTAASLAAHTFEFKPTKSGTYKFKAELSRSGETTKKESVEVSFDFTLPFSAPENLRVVDKSEGDTAAVELSWAAVTGADCYVVIAKEKDAAADAVPAFKDENVTDTKVTINTGLQREKTYIFSVQGKINATETEAAKTTEASEVEFAIPAASSGDDDKIKKTYVLDISADEDYNKATSNMELTAGGSKRFGENDFFTLYYKKSGPSRIEPDAKTFTDGYTSTHCINLQANGDVGKLEAVIKFTTSDAATVKVWWRGGGSAGRQMVIFNEDGSKVIDESALSGEASELNISTLSVTEAGTYYLGCKGGANRVFKVEVETTEDKPKEKTYTLDISADEDYNKATANMELTAGGSKRFGENDFFTLYYKKSGPSRIEPDAKTFTDGYTSTHCINLQANGDVSKLEAVIKFTTIANAQVKVWWRGGGSAGRQMVIFNEDGSKVIDESALSGEATELNISTLSVTEAGTYYLGCKGGANRVFKVEVTTMDIGSGPKTRVEFPGTIAAPVIKSIELDANKKGNLNVLVDANVDYYEGGDRITVYMKNINDTEGTEEVSAYSAVEQATHTIPFTPTASGTYSFRAVLSRDGVEEVINGAEAKTYENFILPLAKPSISRTTNKGVDGDGLGSIEIAYNSIPEAVKYFASAVEVEEVEENGKTVYKTVEGAQPITVESEKTIAVFSGLIVDKYYAFTVYAYRGDGDTSDISDPSYKIVKNEEEQIWDFSAYGVSTDISGTTTNVDGEKVIKNDRSGDVNDGELRIWALNNGGKIVPDSSEDGVSFVYTTVDKDTNFTLEATAHVNSWTYSNGQEGFGLMMADDVGENGYTGTFWNNTYMAVATKMQYYWDGASILPSEVGPAEGRTRYNMYLGIGSIERTGVTDAWKDEQAAGASKPSLWSAISHSLEHGAPTAGKEGGSSNSYNVIGNHVAGAGKKTSQDIEPLLTDIRLRIQKNNTGYFITYIDANGIETTQKVYDSAIYESNYAKQHLLQIDKEHIHVGFFAARNADVTFSDISFKTVKVADDDPPEETPPTYTLPVYTIPSASITNSDEYELQFNTNWQGTLSIKDAAGNELVNEALYKYLAKQETTVLGALGYENTNKFDKFFTYEYQYDGYVKDENGEDKLDENGDRIPNYTLDENNNKIIDYTTVRLKANVKALIPIVADVTDAEGNIIEEGVNQASLLSVGANTFTYTFTPDRNWHLNDDEHQFLSSYDTFVQTVTVNYRKYGTNESNLYVSPTGKASGDGTQESPLDIYTAVKYVQAGQTIVLMDGTYNLKSPLTIDRGIDGTKDKPIRMVTQNPVNRSNPWEKSSVIIDFSGVASGMTIAGDYWYFRGFDVTNSSDGNKGIQVSGSYNVLDQINTYANGNTGIQLSRYKGTDIDMSDDWPAYNTILNCTSYLNADSGFEDADGFAAKLTIGKGNLFDGCIAAYNADDGWDLYAKAESGKIGQVTIQNCVAFKNGYVLWDNNGKLDINGTNEINAGNGNGFKMGGESIKGHHMLLNSYSFLNKANGIESNSCPDIQVFNSVSFNNGAIKDGAENGANIAFYTRNASYTEYRAYNIISIRTTDSIKKKDNFDKATPSGTGNSKDQNYDNDSNFYWKTESSTVAENGKNAQIKTDDFANLTFGGISTITRNANGTINMGNFLSLKDTADKTHFVDLVKSTLTDPDGVTYNTYVAAEGETSDLLGVPSIGGTGTNDEDAKVDPDKDTDGTIDSSDDTDSSTSDIWTDEEFAQLDKTGSTLKILLDLDYDKNGNYYVDYTGTAIKPTVRVAYGTTELSKKNYSVSYKNNVKAYELLPGDEGFDEKLAPTVIIKGKGNYAGQYNLYYTIKKIDMGSSDKVVSADITTVATGKAQKIKPVVTFDGKNLNAKEYQISDPYTIVKDAETGEPTGETASYTDEYKSGSGDNYIYIDLVGADANFTGTKTIRVKVLASADGLTPMSKVKVAKIPDQIYDGTAHYPAITVDGLTPSTTDSEGALVQGDYDVVYYNNTDIGIASVVLTGNIEKGYYGTKTVTFKTIAKPFNVKDYSVTVRHNGTYYTTDEEYKNLKITTTGSAVTFGNIVVKVTANEGSADKTLMEGVDYTVSYSGNNKAGKASIIIKGMGDFKGKMTRTFTIDPLLINESNTTVTVADQEYVKGGVKPSVVVKVNGKTISPSYYNVSYKNNNKISTDSDKASVSITGKKLLKGNVKDAATFSVNPKNLSTLTVSADDVYYGTAKTENAPIKYATKLAVLDSNGKKLSLKSDYDVNYYYYNSENVYTKLEKNDTIPYDGGNTTIYVEIVPGTKGFYTGTLNGTYNVVGKNDIRSAKIEKITDTYAYNDTAVAVPTDKLVVKIQNRTLGSDGKYVKDRDYTTLTLNTDYKIVNIKNNDRYGTATVTIQGMGSYCGTNKATFKITKKELSSWNYYIAYAVVNNITVDVDEADIKAGGKYAGAFTFDDIEITTKGDDGQDVVTTEKSPLASAAKITDASGNALTYNTHFDATYTDNTIDAATLVYGEDGYATKDATVTIKGISPYTGSKTIAFTIRVKKQQEAEQN